MMWFWLNIPLAVVFFGAWSGIPLAMVLRNPDWGSAKVGTPRVRQTQPEPADVVYRAEPRVEAPVLAGTNR
jgi:hypothetical protein